MFLRFVMKFSSILLSVLVLSACSYYEKLFSTEVNGVEPISTVEKIEEAPMSLTKVYDIAATRITNRMLDDSADIYEAKPISKLYIKKILKNSENLSDGLYNAQKSIKKIVNASGTYTVVDKIEDADFILASKVRELNNGTQPIVLFNMDILNKQEKPIKSWSVTIRQMPEDKSWW